MAMIGNEIPRHSSDNLQSSRLPVSSPWNQVVRGESEFVPAVSSSLLSEEPFPSATTAVDVFNSDVESSDNGGEHNGGTDKRPAWSKPSSNGAASEVRPVMDAHSWPALTDSARAYTKSESSKGLLDGSSVPQSQGMESVPSSSSPTQRQAENHVNLNNMAPTRQKPIKHNSSNASSNGGHTQQSAPQVAIVATGSHNSFSKDHTQRSGSVSSDHHPQQRNSFRNRSSGPHQRGDGSHHHNYGNRRDQDWNSRRNFNGRDMHVPPRVSPRIIRPSLPPNSAQFIHPQSLRPFGGHMGFHELAPPVVFVAPPPPPLDSLESACPSTVSCADILTLAAREAIYLSKGSFWAVPLGRRDDTTANESEANNLPSPFEPLENITAKFVSKGLEKKDVAVLSGAHTFGFAQCFLFKPRLFDFGGSGKPDPSLDSPLLQNLQKTCPNQADSNTNLAPLDPVTTNTFDNTYCKNVLSNTGLLQSDQALLGGSNPRKGDVLVIAVATLYAFSNVNEAMFRRRLIQRPRP